MVPDLSDREVGDSVVVIVVGVAVVVVVATAVLISGATLWSIVWRCLLFCGKMSFQSSCPL